MPACACAQLTPECTDLLNKIFVIDEKKRITVPEIKEHAWYTRPLLPKYAAAEADIGQRQAQVEAYIKRRDLNIVRTSPNITSRPCLCTFVPGSCMLLLLPAPASDW